MLNDGQWRGQIVSRDLKASEALTPTEVKSWLNSSATSFESSVHTCWVVSLRGMILLITFHFDLVLWGTLVLSVCILFLGLYFSTWITGTMTDSINWPAPNVWVFIANAEAVGSNPVEAPKTFFGFTLRFLKSQSQLRWLFLHFIVILSVVYLPGKQNSLFLLTVGEKPLCYQLFHGFFKTTRITRLKQRKQWDLNVRL